MSDQEVKDIVHQYLKDKLRVSVDVSARDVGQRDPEVSVTVSIFLGDEEINSYSGCS